jgi:hypothetical protein
MKRFPLLAAILCGWLMLSTQVSGGLLSNAGLVQYRALDVVVLTYGSTAHAYYKLSYYREVDDFVWIIPVPGSVFAVNSLSHNGGWSWNDAQPLDGSDGEVSARFNWPPSYCADLFGGYLSMGSGSVTSDSVFLNIELLAEHAQLESWLVESGHTIDDSMQMLLSEYAANGHRFLVMTSGDSTFGELRPGYGEANVLQLQYRVDYRTPLTIPLGILEIGPRMDVVPVTVWIAADTPFRVQNYPEIQVAYNNMRSRGALTNPDPDENVWDGGLFNNYPLVRSESARAADEPGFILEYSGSTNAVRETEYETSLQFTVRQHYSFITRYYTEFESENEIEDAIFAPAPDEPELPPVDLTDYVDPLQFYGCSTRERRAPLIWEDLPEGRDEVFSTVVAYPDNWIRSDLVINDHEIAVYAPTALTEGMLAEIANGEIEIPFFFIYQAVMIEAVQPAPHEMIRRDYSAPVTYLEDIQFVPFSLNPGTYVFGALFPDASADAAMLRAMLNYAVSLPYLLHPELLNTLFLDRAISIGFPDGWVERLDRMDIVIEPEEDGTGERLRLRYVWDILGISREDYAPTEEDYFAVTETLDAEYGTTLQSAGIEDWLEAYGAFACNTEEPPVVEFEHESRRGYLKFLDNQGQAVVEASAPTAEFDDLQPLLETLIETAQVQRVCG